MSPKNNAANKIRPILRAMEQSIEAARSTRLQPVKAPVPATNHVPLVAPVQSVAVATRLKARPKRSWM